MIRSVFSDSAGFYAFCEGTKRYLPDPFRRDNLRPSRVAIEPRYVPCYLLRGTRGHVLCFVDIGGEAPSAILWELSPQLDYEGQRRVSVSFALSLLWNCASEQQRRSGPERIIDDCFLRGFRSAMATPEALRRITSCLDAFLTTGFAETVRPLPLLEPGASSFCDIDLAGGGEDNLTGLFLAHIDEYRSFWQRAWDNPASVSSSAPVPAHEMDLAETVREARRHILCDEHLVAIRSSEQWSDIGLEAVLGSFFAIRNGYYLSLKPTTGGLVASTRSHCLRNPPTILVLHEDGCRSFVECRVWGFMDNVHLLAFPYCNMIVRVNTRCAWGDWAADSERLASVVTGVNAFIAESREEGPRPRRECARVYIHFRSFPNLGHYIWNSLSGAHLIDAYLASEDFGGRRTVALVTDFAGGSSLSSPFADAPLSQQIPPDLFWHDEARTRSLEGMTPAELDGSLHCCFKSVFIPEGVRAEILELANERRRDAVTERGRNTFTVCFNLRTHNKRLLNAAHCLCALLESARQAERAPVRLLIETDASEQSLKAAEALKQSITQGGHADDCSIAAGLQVVELIRLLSGVDLFVGPIGSAIVIPSWILGMPVITYGDRNHRKQRKWWHKVGPTGAPELTHFIPDRFFIDDDRPSYSDFRILPRGFAEAFEALFGVC